MGAMNKIQVNYIDIDIPIPYENNPRYNDNAVDEVANSIKEYGFKNPIVLDKNNVIIAGHTRLKAAKKLGLKQVPTIKADDLTEEQVRAFRLADNKTAELAEWNYDLLEIELDEIPNIDMEQFGFDTSDVFNHDNETDSKIRDIEIEKRAETNQIWSLGKHRLLCGDCTNQDNIDRLMNGERAKIVYTDPPYGINLDTDYTSINGGWTNKVKAASNNYKKVIADDKPYNPEHIFKSFSYCDDIFLWGGNTTLVNYLTLKNHHGLPGIKQTAANNI